MKATDERRPAGAWRYRSRRRAQVARVAGLLLALAGAGAARAQVETTGAITGRVVDKDNERVALAGVTVVASGPQGDQATITDDDGIYGIHDLPLGAYVVRFFLANSSVRVEQPNVIVSLDKTVEVNARLPSKVQAAEVYTVTERAPAIDIGSTRTGADLDESFTRNVPVGRNFGSVLEKAPGAFVDRSGNVSIGGSSGTENQYILDGINVSSLEHGELGSNLVTDFIQETEIITGGYGAEYGGSMGGIVNVVTKSGSNDFHGSVFGFWSPYWMTASPQPVFRQAEALKGVRMPDYATNVGLEVGGPLVKDRLFFWVGFAPSVTKTHLIRIVDRAIDANGDGQQDYDPKAGRYAVEEVARFRLPSDTASEYQYAAKIDYKPSEDHSLSLRLSGAPGTAEGVEAVTGTLDSESYRSTTNTTDVSARWLSRLFHRSMDVEAQVGLHHESFEQGAMDPQFDQLNAVFTQGLGPGSSPDLADLEANPAFQQACAPVNDMATGYHFNPCPVASYKSGGYGVVESHDANRAIAQLKLTNRFRAAGHHELKYGASFEHDTFDHSEYYTGPPGGRALVSLTPFGYTIQSFFSLPPGEHGYQRTDYDEATQNPDPNMNGSLADLLDAKHYRDVLATSTVTNNTAMFLQDRYTILPDLTVNLGVRLEGQELEDSQGNKAIDIGLLQNVGPRVGVIYDPTHEGRSKLYGHWGRFFESIPMTVNTRAFGGEGVVQQNYYTFDHTTGLCTSASQDDWRSGDPRKGWQSCDRSMLSVNPWANPALNGQLAHYGVISSGENFLVQKDLGSEYLDEIVLGGQVELFENFTLGLSYTNRRLRNIIEDASGDNGNTYVISNPGNVPDHVLRDARADAAAKKATLDKLDKATTDKAQYAQVENDYLEAQSIADNLDAISKFPQAERSYDAVSVTAAKRFSRNWLVQASYTYSRVLGNYAGLYDGDFNVKAANITTQYDLMELLYNKWGPLPTDRPHNARVDGFYTQAIRENTFLTYGVGFAARSGAPISYVAYHPTYLANGSFLLPRGIGGRTPATTSLDLHVAYRYRIGPGTTVEAGLDLFNVLDERKEVLVDQLYSRNVMTPIVGGTTDDLKYAKTETSGAPAAPVKNLNFGNGIAYQAPFTGRLSLRLLF